MTIEQMIARQQELLNAARSAGRNMTREEAAEFDSLQRSIDAARAAGAGIAHGGQSSTPAAPANNTPEGQRQQTPAAGEGGNGGQDPQNAQRAIEAERQRIRSIEDLCTEFGLEARSYIDNGSTEEQVRAAVLECRRRTQLDLRRKACTAQTYDTGIGNFLHDFLGSQTAFLHQRFGTVNGFFPFIPFYVNEYSRLGVTAGIDNRVNLSDFPADRRMNGC